LLAFSFARDAGYLVKGKPTEAESTTVAKQGDGEIEVFSPEEFSAYCPPPMRTFYHS